MEGGAGSFSSGVLTGRMGGNKIEPKTRKDGEDMDKKYCIFDMDGTLVDSMGYWHRLGFEYLSGNGMSEADARKLFEQGKAMTLLQGAQLFLDALGVEGEPMDVLRDMREIMGRHYREDVERKPGVLEYLHKLKAEGCRLCVATATEEDMAHLCLRRLGLEDCFEFLLSCQTLGSGKDDPEIYLQAARRLGAQPEECAVFEDALFAAQTAKRAGFYTAAVQDDNQAKDWDELSALADEVILDWRNLLTNENRGI